MKRKLTAITICTALALATAAFFSTTALAGGGAPGGGGRAGGAGAPGGGGMGMGGPGGGGMGMGGPGGGGMGMGGPGGGGMGMGGPGGGGMGGRGGAPAGPPATVPAEVAIQHPTDDEVTRLNTALKRLIDSAPEKDLFQKFPPTITVPPNRANPCIAPVQTGVRTTQRHDGFVNTAKTGDFDILWDGDSITDFWQQSGAQGGAEVQKKHFGDIKIANFAVGGDTTQGVLWGLQNGEGQGHKPKAIMLMIGTNNGSNTAGEVAEGVGAIVWEMRHDFPDAKILLLAIFPRADNAGTNQKNIETNKIIAKLDDGKHVFFKNINDKFLNPQGRLIGFRGDNLHPAADGYEIWASAVEDTLKSWIK